MEPYCYNCPDHKACGTGYPCDVVLSVEREAGNRILSEGGRVFHTPDDSQIISKAVTAAILGQIQAPGLAVEEEVD